MLRCARASTTAPSRGDDEHPGELFGITAVQARLGQKVFEAFGPGCEHLQQNVVSLPRRAQKGRGAAL
ncbi:hypothetical protein [Arthrobacter sp. M4]|uniref:hypothetical protein n=1 Tax=Arthrobacter sp. M4 TaxID=218160 RepID=UPI001CDB8EEC|nr:hypothetical protein [Arthrobacter sp. M4]MCA4131825.1 hypothetical protein [Arthrobacter sp. M4]